MGGTCEVGGADEEVAGKLGKSGEVGACDASSGPEGVTRSSRRASTEQQPRPSAQPRSRVGPAGQQLPRGRGKDGRASSIPQGSAAAAEQASRR